MKPRLDVFPVTGLLVDGGVLRVLPGKESFQKYAMGNLYCGMDYAFVQTDNFFVYAGLDVIVGAVNVDYTDYVPTYKDESYTGGGILAGFRFRLGVEYSINDKVGIFLNANRSYGLIAEPKTYYSANAYGFGMRYSFK